LDAVTVRPGGRTSAYVIALRTDGFSGPIRVEARDLPAGISAQPITIGPGQIIAPIVFEAADSVKPGIGTVTLVGLGRFGDRRGARDRGGGAQPPGRDTARGALAGGMPGPPPANAQAVAPARLFHGFVMAALGDPAPLALSIRPMTVVAAQGRQLDLDVSV